VVARFLGLLELYRDGAVSFDQAEALSELRVRWIGGALGSAERNSATEQQAAGQPAWPGAGPGSGGIDPDEEYG
jgi:segregation and condensation protein A